MAIEEKRKHSRIDSLHLLNYIHYGDSEDDATQGMGRTLNVSESGILLETHVSIDVDHTVQLTIGIEENVVDIKGSVVYSQKNAKGMYESGIEFFNVDAAAQKVLKAYISEFNAASGR
jgi:c-di-GMP-binding flagellar brake protein YcgR